MIITDRCLPFPGESFFYSSTFCDLSDAKEGDFVQFEGCTRAFQVSKLAKISQSFQVKRHLKCVRPENPIELIFLKDEFKFIYQTYEIDSLIVHELGKGFTEGMEFPIAQYDQETIVEVPSNMGKIEIAEVGEKGKIASLEILNRGIFRSPEPIKTRIPNANGLDALVEAILRPACKMTEMGVFEDSFLYRFPVANPADGHLLIEKFKVWTTAPLPKNMVKIPTRYQISSEFTPHLKIPLLAKGSFYSESIINANFLALDARIAHLEKLTTGRS